MAININREKARLDKTIAAITTKEAEVKKLETAATTIREHFHPLTVTLNMNLAKIDALVIARNDAKDRLEANVYPDDGNRQVDVAQVKAAEESIQKLATDNTAIQQELNNLHATFDAQLDEITKSGEALDLALCALMVTKQQQEDALKRQEADYPQKLKRHLAKCRRHGWQDARLGQPKKKAS